MQPIKLLDQVLGSFTKYHFIQSDDFRWSPNDNTVYYRRPKHNEDIWSLLHEIAHAELGHTTFNLDIELLNHETQAWAHATSVLAPRFGVRIDDEYMQDHLDTYREWMFERSLCPTCGQTGLQTQNTYRCINCRCLWRANEARLCALRRTRLLDQIRTVS